jgi:solute carrier family 44 (choline transporter-like protein), member 2/4/5
MMQLVMQYLEEQGKKSGGNNAVLKVVFSAIHCYLSCLKRIVEFVNKNAYIQIALSGKNFCSAMKDAFAALSSNFLRFATVSSLGGVFVFIGICNFFTFFSYF